MHCGKLPCFFGGSFERKNIGLELLGWGLSVLVLMAKSRNWVLGFVVFGGGGLVGWEWGKGVRRYWGGWKGFGLVGLSSRFGGGVVRS